MAREPLERPGQRRRRACRGRTTSSADELVAQVAVGRRVAVLVALLEQQAEHRVVARARRARRATTSSSSASKRSTASRKRAPRAARPEVALDQRHRQHPRHRAHACRASRAPRRAAARPRPRRGRRTRRAGSSPASGASSARASRRARASCPARAGRAPRPAGRTRAMRSPWNGAWMQPPLAHVLVAVEEQDRVLAGERPQELPALPGGRDRRVEPEDLAHRVGVREQHHRLARSSRSGS